MVGRTNYNCPLDSLLFTMLAECLKVGSEEYDVDTEYIKKTYECAIVACADNQYAKNQLRRIT